MVITLQEESCDSLIQFYLVQIHLSLHYFDSRFLCRKDVLRITWSYLEKTMQANQFQTANSQLETLCWHCCSFSPFYYDDFRFSEILPSLKLLKIRLLMSFKNFVFFNLSSNPKSGYRVVELRNKRSSAGCQCHCNVIVLFCSCIGPYYAL